jgi:ATP-binding cassette subfamily F protein 3
MKREFPDHKEGLLKNHLAKASIGPGPANTRMQNLSFSQRSCIIFAKLTYIAPHLLIMDEPTNFLDLESVDSLIAASNKYQGALLLVSHNRDFLKKCAKQYLSIVPGKFDLFDDLKSAERATYTFVAELEAGATGLKGDISAALANNSGETGKQKKAAEEKKEKKGEFVFGSAPTAASKALDAKFAASKAKPVAKPAEEEETKKAAGGRGKQQAGAKQAGGRGAKQAGGAKAAGGRGAKPAGRGRG